MLIITFKTDNPEAEIGLFDDAAKIVYLTWPAHRELAETIHLKLRDTLAGQGRQFDDVQGIIFFKGPGSFTGLRIGASVANALADGLGVPIVGTDGQDWISQGIERLLRGEADKIALPEYGAPPHITPPRK